MKHDLVGMEKCRVLSPWAMVLRSTPVLPTALGRVDTKPNNASFLQNFTHSALKSLDRRQPACDFLPCLRKIYARKSAYYLSVNTP